MKTWYYSIDSDIKIGPVDESEIRERLKNQELTENTLLWSSGMDQWVRLSQTTTFGTPHQPPILQGQPPVPLAIPTGLRSWITFLGICLLISGILACISVVGILPGIPLLLAGTALFGARSALNEPVEMDEFLARIRTAIISISSLFIASVLLFFLSLLIIAPLFGAAMAAHGFLR